MDGIEDDEVSGEVRAHAVMDAVARFAASRPITVEMRPFRNPYTDEVQGVVLTDLFADEPGNGVGGAVIREMLRLADEANVSVYTDADGPRSAAFYARMGFERSPGRGHQLVHHPPLPDYLRDEDHDPAGAPGPG